jgi:hypothetical protein
VYVFDIDILFRWIERERDKVGMCGVSVNTESTDTFVTDTDSQRTLMISASLITEILKIPTLISLEHW